MNSHPLQSNEVLINVSLVNDWTVQMSETCCSVKTVTHDSQALSCLYF